MTVWIDWILAGMVAEGIGLLLLRRWTGRGVAAAGLLPNLAAGMMLLLAMRLALTGAAWPLVSACLLGGLAGHVLDLRYRWR